MRGWMRISGFALAFSLMSLLPGYGLHALAEAPAVTAYTLEEQQLLDAYHSGSIIRLHILAEDDTKAAQAMKLAVRDALLSAFSQDLHGTDVDSLYQQLQQSTEAMRSVAEETALALGFSGQVTAEVGILPLPEKRYGEILLPEGEYRALRITLGKGEGQNWWCVLFPSLCLAVADDQPWRAQGDQDGPAEASPTVVWDSEKIFAEWLLWPGVQ